MTEDSRRIPPAPCPGDPHNCELLLSSQEAYRGRCAQAEISGHEAVVSAMAVGLANTLCAESTGITNKSLRALMTGLLGTTLTP